MSTATTPAPFVAAHPQGPAPTERAAVSTFVTMTVCGQLCGIPVLSVRDIIVTQAMTRIPLAPREIAGSLNLRGRIVTAIDLRRRLGLPDRERGQLGMSVVVERQGELYSLVVDTVREVLELDDAQFELNPPTLAAAWREHSTGIYRLKSDLLVVLNTERVLAIGQS
jgi:purine-binding chemotaxis protein CheW